MTPILFKITDIGRQAVLDAPNTGLTLRLKNLAIGTGRYQSTGNETALQQEVGRFVLSVADITHDKQLIFSCSILTENAVSVSEFGLFDENGRLFAIASSPDEILMTYSDVEFVGEFSLALDNLDVSKIELITDPHGGLALNLMSKHLANEHPHSQYLLANDANRKFDSMEQMVTQKLETFSQLIELLKKQAQIPIGGLFTTLKHYTAQSLRDEKGYGNWIQIGRGRALVGQSDTGWTSKLGVVAGSDTHTLTISEMPEHNHNNATYNRLMTVDGNGTLKGSASDWTAGEPNLFTSAVMSSSGGNKPHNIRQKSLVVAIWQRVADDYKAPVVRVYFTSDPQGTNRIDKIEQDRDTYFWVELTDYQDGQSTTLYPYFATTALFGQKAGAVLGIESVDLLGGSDSGLGMLKPLTILPITVKVGRQLLTKLDGTVFNAYKTPILTLGVIDETGKIHQANLGINGKFTDKNAWKNSLVG